MRLLQETRWHQVGTMLVQATRDLFNDNAPQWAAAVSYYALLSVFPLILAGISLASLFVDPDWAVQQVSGLLGNLMPEGQARVGRIVRQALEQRGVAGLFSTLTLLWSGTRVFGTLTQALNIAYDVDELYGFWRRRLAELLMLVSVGVVFFLALVSRPVLDLLWRLADVAPAGTGTVFWMVKEGLQVLLLALAFFLLYRFAPRRRPSWQATLPGALLATLLFILARLLFFEFVSGSARYNMIYGSVAAAVLLVMWVWVATLVLLFCGEIVSHTQAMLIEGRSAGEVDERHRARAPSHQP